MISIIIPVYNAAQYLYQALQSLEIQTYENIEIIMVDDGSSDGSKEICCSFTERDPRFRYFYQENQGVSAARNTALAYAQGEYVAFLDSDDWVEPDYVESMFQLLESTSADVAITLPFSKKNRKNISEPIVFSRDIALQEMYLGKRFEGFIWSKIFRKELLEGICFPEGIAFLEDMIFAARAIAKAERVAFQAVPKYHYRLNPASATKAKWNPRVWTCMDAAKMLYRIMEENVPEAAAYGGKVACYTNLVIAQKLAGCRRLDPENYAKVRDEILKYYNADVEKLLAPRLKYELHLFLQSRRLYTLCRRFFKSKIVMKLRSFISR